MDKRMKQSSLLNFFSKSPKTPSTSCNENGHANKEESPLAGTSTPSRTPKSGLSSRTPKSELSSRTPKSELSKRGNQDKSSFQNVGKKLKMDIEEMVEESSEKIQTTSINVTPTIKAKVTNGTPISSKSKSILRSSNTPSTSKKRKLVIHSSSSEDEDMTYKPEEKSSSEAYESDESESPNSTAKSISAKKSTPFKSASLKTVNLTPKSSKQVNSTTKKEVSAENGVSSDSTHWTHLKLAWLKPEKLRDANRLSMDNPNHDPSTLHVPQDFLQSCTPAMKQWWNFKRQQFDTVLFFKMGKFYELYHMDAVIAHQELGLKFMKGGDNAHNGFPEISYTHHSSVLIEKGYKVARIEQMETPLMMTDRCKKNKGAKVDKVVRRTICEVSTKGVRLPSFQNADTSYEASTPPEASYIFCIQEKVYDEDRPLHKRVTEYGICFLDTTIGTFHVSQFKDTATRSRLSTLFSQYKPAQVIYCKNPDHDKLTAETLKVVGSFTGVKLETVMKEDFWSAEEVIKFCLKDEFFLDVKTGDIVIPYNLMKIIVCDAPSKVEAKQGWELGVGSFGGMVAYLVKCRAFFDILSLKQLELYFPLEKIGQTLTANTLPDSEKYMVLDSTTLRNLEIVDGPNSILSVVDRCRTHFGKRLLRKWVCFPLGNPDSIKDRLDAIEDMMSLKEMSTKISPILNSIPDLERLVKKMHIMGSEHRSKVHPDGHAQLFDSIKYSKNKIYDFINILKGIKKCRDLIDLMTDFSADMSSNLLVTLVSKFPCMDTVIAYFDKAFNPEAALKEGQIIPLKGACSEYDNSLAEIESVNEEALTYLKNVSREFNCRVEFFGSDKKRFQLQFPESKKVPTSKYRMSSSKKGFKRYVTDQTDAFVARIIAAETTRDAVLGDVTRQMFWSFDENRNLWTRAVEIIAEIDALLSLATFSKSQNGMCRPNVVVSNEPFLKIIQGRHPSYLSETYIPNDCFMSPSAEDGSTGRGGNFILLTGANMGGKSTLMRQVGLIAILAHIGCYVPAEKCDLSIIDRVFTRIGANDNIGGGESTFQVEVSETASVLKNGTKHSLVLIDELGRGTATYDGMSIAQSVAIYLAQNNMRTIFATHYHSLGCSLKHYDSVQMKHMAYEVKMVQEGETETEELTFLYVMANGMCDKSYGFNAAKISGVSASIVKLAQFMGDEFEDDVSCVDQFRHRLMAFRSLTAPSL